MVISSQLIATEINDVKLEEIWRQSMSDCRRPDAFERDARAVTPSGERSSELVRIVCIENWVPHLASIRRLPLTLAYVWKLPC